MLGNTLEYLRMDVYRYVWVVEKLIWITQKGCFLPWLFKRKKGENNAHSDCRSEGGKPYSCLVLYPTLPEKLAIS
ncbi:hypothetical protein Tco_0460684, partial [Tanacetum coccineum]